MHALLTVELHEVNDAAQRKAFEDELAVRNWIYIMRMTWRASFEAQITDARAIVVTEQDVEAARVKAKISKKLTAAVHMGPARPTTF